jgi:hypothetical protein
MLPAEGLQNHSISGDADDRWDHISVHEFLGTYGEYLLNKVSRVFPELRDEVF